MAATDLTDLASALAYIGETADAGTGDALVQEFITTASAVLDARCGPLVSRLLVAVDAGDSPTFTYATGTTGATLGELLRHVGVTDCSIGTAADPWATSPACKVTGVDLVAGTVDVDVSVTAPADTGIYAGRYLPGFEPATAGAVPAHVQLACLHVIRNRWQFEQGAPSDIYDAPAPSPWMIPFAALELLSDDIGLGFA